MKIRRSAILLLFVVSFLSSVRIGHAAPQWEPAKTWVFFVSLVKWKDSDSFESFPEENRKDIVFLDTLRKRGVTDDHIAYLKDSAATTAAVERRFDEFLRKPGPDDWVLVYFSGHGYKNDDGVSYLATYDVDDERDGWRFDAVPAAIDRYFRGSHAIIALDACFSGAMANDVKRVKRRVSYAVFASSLASQESTSDWTFTEALISAFGGAPFVDQNHDGHITFDEMGRNAVEDMLFGEEQMATIAYTGNFDSQAVVADSTPPASPRIGERVEAYSQDGWYKGYIADIRADQYRIHYYGYDDSEDEWVTTRSIRSPKVVHYVIGEKVDVQWKKQWYPATVLRVKASSQLVKYAVYGNERNEWVSSARIRRRT